MHRLAVARSDVFLLDARVRVVREMLLGGLGAAQDARHGLGLIGHIDAMLELEVLQHMLDDLVVEVVAAQVIVPMACDHLDDPSLDAHDRRIEGSPTKIVDQDALALMLRGLIDQRCGRRFIDYANHLQACDLAGLPGGLPLGVGEIGGNGDHRLAHRLLQAVFSSGLEALEDDGRDFLSGIFRSAESHLRVAPHSAFDRTNGALGIENVLIARLLADKQLPRFRDPDHRGKDHAPELIGEHIRAPLLVEGNFGVRSTKVDPYDKVHHMASSFPSRFATITSAGRNKSSFQRKPGRSSSTTCPSAAPGRTTVATAVAMRGSNARPTVSVGTTRRSASIRSRRRTIMPIPSRSDARASCSTPGNSPSYHRIRAPLDLMAACKRSRTSMTSSSSGLRSSRCFSCVSARARFNSWSIAAWLICRVSKTLRNWSSASFSNRDCVRTSMRRAANSTNTDARSLASLGTFAVPATASSSCSSRPSR